MVTGRADSAAARARQLRTPLVRLVELVGVRTVYGCEAARWEAGAVGERRTARASHRVFTHGGYVSDGEQIVTPPRLSFFDLPREQQVFGPLLIVAIVIGILARTL